MGILEILILLTIHFIADFIFQDEKWALGKSSFNTSLLKHTITYSLVWLFIGLFIKIFYESIFINFEVFSYLSLFKFVLVTFVFHTITDYFTSRIVAKKFANNHMGSSIPNFGAFTIIGFDQLLHYFQLLITYKIL